MNMKREKLISPHRKIKKSELNAIEPVKKRKVNWPSEEEELCALDTELKDFNYEDMDMDRLVIKDPEDGEVDDDSVTDEASV